MICGKKEAHRGKIGNDTVLLTVEVNINNLRIKLASHFGLINEGA